MHVQYEPMALWLAMALSLLLHQSLFELLYRPSHAQLVEAYYHAPSLLLAEVFPLKSN